jgi:hypothetical protein
MTSAIITICIGREQRLFAAHEDVLGNSPYLSMLCQSQFYESTKRIDLPDEEPEIFSSVLEYLYKGDYYPRLEFDKRRQSWQLEDGTNPERQSTIESTVFMNGVGVVVLKDTVIYVCYRSMFTISPCTDSFRSAQPKNMVFQNSSASLFASKVYNLASSAPPSSPAHAMPTPTRPTTTPNSEPTISPSSSAADTHSSAAAPCRWKWRPVESYSSTSSSHYQITWTISPEPERRHDTRLTRLLLPTYCGEAAVRCAASSQRGMASLVSSFFTIY